MHVKSYHTGLSPGKREFGWAGRGTFACGEVVALLGPNGTGKTTQFNVLAGVVRPSAGQVRFQGEDIAGYRVDQISSLGIGRTFQRIRVFQGLSVEDNVRWHRLVRGSCLVCNIVSIGSP
jgi:ABC-type branched-subunit amino acid transport system ATPase component